ARRQRQMCIRDREFGTPYVLIAALECEPSAYPARRQLAAEMQRQLEAMRDLVKGAAHRLDLSGLKNSELYLTTTNDLAEIRATLAQESPWLRRLTANPTLMGFFEMADARFAAEQAGGKLQSTGESVQGLTIFAKLFGLMQSAATNTVWQPPAESFWEDMFAPSSVTNYPAEMREGYFVSYDGRVLYMFIEPASPSRELAHLRRLVDTTREVFAKIQQTQPAYATIKLGLTGDPASAVEEADSTNRDMQVFGTVSLIGVTLLLMAGFRGFKFPLMLVAALGVGMAWTFGLTVLMIGHLNLLTQVTPIILIGLGMDFGIHLLARYREQQRRGSPPLSALREAIVENGMSVIMSAVTTAVAFYSISVDNFKGFVEMGIVAGTGVMCCLVSMMTVLPAMIALRRVPRDELAKTHPAAVPVGVDPTEPLHPPFVERLFRYPWWILGAGAAITVVMVLYWQRVIFDYKLANLHVPNSEAVTVEERMMKNSDFTLDMVSLICRDVAHADEVAKRLEAMPTVRKVESLRRFLGDGAEKKALLASIAPSLKGVFEVAPASQPVDLKQLAAAVDKLAKRLERLEEVAFDGGQKDLAKAIGAALKAAEKFRDTLKDGDAAVAARLGKFQDYFFGDLASKIARFRAGLTAEPITLDSLPADLRSNFVGKSGKVQVYAYPKCDTWDRPKLDEFMKEVGSLGIPVTGPLVEFHTMTGLMRKGFDRAAIYAVVAVYLLLLVDFRRFKAATLTMVPDLLGTVWMVGLMGMTGINFNPANLMVLPLIIGIGLANGVHVMHRFREHRDRDIAHVVWHTGLAVMLGSLVTIVGFGCLGLAQNLGIASI
ncbi:MAG: MMPL family transporter, partial [Verrucomicrobiae bacterium]|nr:MMPL family transporter [Verrucomicrobiae bacterium]